ncbi:hypothetical protein KUCAC02_023211, partial [Chaenocephalus aceratus]
ALLRVRRDVTCWIHSAQTEPRVIKQHGDDRPDDRPDTCCLAVFHIFAQMSNGLAQDSQSLGTCEKDRLCSLRTDKAFSSCSHSLLEDIWYWSSRPAVNLHRPPKSWRRTMHREQP